MDKPPVLVCRGRTVQLQRNVQQEDMSFVINAASQYSPWATQTISSGYITAPGGHRIGICGEVAVNHGKITGLRSAASLCLRVARDFPGVGESVRDMAGSILIIGPPGSGKTTLLRDIIRQRGDSGQGSVAVLDERGEIFPLIQGKSCFESGMHTDILSGCGKEDGLDMLLRTMNPRWIAVDEITRQEDTIALRSAGWCGVHLLATAHAASKSDFLARPVYRQLVLDRLFDHLLVLEREKSWRAERI
jgi:stage III sporulation protein AA